MEATLNKNENYTWKFVKKPGNIMEFCHCGKMGTLIICLVSVLMSAVYYQVSCWMQYQPLGAQLLGFAPLQHLGFYLWQAYVQPGDGHWPTPGMHRVAAPCTTLSRGSLMLLHLLFPAILSI